eukprot:TRINITY_DN32802_c0_g1_i1.p1 TRINITY_DN32802_c0_g1~~TRINITY_DN32802_c0_g1_i1.p1  ORF type:complete len:1736 (-),score=379.97 TRINITY_DN32802_c0_g1_i1:118-4563(-)
MGMDIQAMKIFIEHHQYKFFLINLGGVFLGLLWTAFEFHAYITEDHDSAARKITPVQIFFSGVTLPLLGQHVTYLAGLSLYQGSMHPFLFVSTLAEAILESSISSIIQTYAVVFSEMTDAVKVQLYISIGVSFVSIGYAFSTLDQVNGGRVLAKLPGFCKKFDGRFFTVFFFRCSEITSRITSLALFQMVTRPFGGTYLLAADFVVMFTLTIIFQYHVGKAAPADRWLFVQNNVFYVVPSVLCCLMAPMLEKDCVLTMPPSVYYSVRILELGAMVAVAGEVLEWDIEQAQDLFSDDGLVIVACSVSTLLMIILGFVVRMFLGVRTVIDSHSEVWSQSEFNLVQHALRNRILLGSTSEADIGNINKIKEALQGDVNMSSKQCRALVQGASSSSAEDWEANFLRAKASLLIHSAVQSLQDATNVTDSMKGSKEALKIGSLIMLHSSGGGGNLTCRDEEVVGQFFNESCNQKFVLESPAGNIAQQDVLSGCEVLIRSVSTGSLLGLEPVSAEAGSPTFALHCHSNWQTPEASKFELVLVHEDLFKTATKFHHHVQMADDTSLMVARLDQTMKRKGQLSKSWSTEGWQIISINGREATRADVDEILQKAKKARPAMQRGTSGVDDKSEVGSIAGSDIQKSINPGEAAAAKGEYMISFVKVNRGSPIRPGDKVMLRHAAGWTASAVGMSQGSATGTGGEAEEVMEFPKPRIVEGQQGLAFTIEEGEFGSKDDPSIYAWAADFINGLQNTLTLQESVAEKYRMLTVIAYNSRTTGVEGVSGILHADRKLHLKLLESLLMPICNEKDITIEYEDCDDLFNELNFDDEEELAPLKIINIWEEDSRAKELGLQLDDELLQLDTVDENGEMKISTTKNSEMREVLFCDFDEEEIEQDFEFLRLTFRVHRKASDNEVAKKAVDQAVLIANLLPTWDEILAHANQVEQETCNDMMMEDVMMQRSGFFQTKCGLVKHLIDTGFELKHDDFMKTALELHRVFDAKTESNLKAENLFPGDSNKEVRDKVLISQLKVLMVSWSSLPRVIKEDSPKELRDFFRPEVELAAMLDGMKVLYRQWEETREATADDDSDAQIEMPEMLVEFFSNIRPANDEDSRGDEKSLFWLTKAYHGQRDKYQAVQELVGEFSKRYESAEAFWERRVRAAREGAEEAQKEMKQAAANETDKAKVILCSGVDDLKKIKNLLDPSTLKLTADCQIKDSAVVPKGLSLVLDQGPVAKHFKTASVKSPDKSRIYRDFELIKTKDKEIRILFSSDDFEICHDENEKAMKRLENDLQQGKSAGKAFPSIQESLDSLVKDMHNWQISKKDQEAQRKLAVQEEELREAMRVAQGRLMQAQAKKESVEEQNRKLEADKMALQAEKDLLKHEKEEVEDQLGTVTVAAEQIEAEKRQLAEKTEQLEKDKEQLRLENEFLDEKKQKMEETLKEVNSYLEEQKSSLERQKTTGKIAVADEQDAETQKSYVQSLMDQVNFSLGF